MQTCGVVGCEVAPHNRTRDVNNTSVWQGGAPREVRGVCVCVRKCTVGRLKYRRQFFNPGLVKINFTRSLQIQTKISSQMPVFDAFSMHVKIAIPVLPAVRMHPLRNGGSREVNTAC